MDHFCSLTCRKWILFKIVELCTCYCNYDFIAFIEDLFYQFMFLAHLVLGCVLIVPVLWFGIVHFWAARNRRNRRAVRIGYALFGISLVVLLSGLLLTRSFGFELKSEITRNIMYWAHIVCPLAAMWL